MKSISITRPTCSVCGGYAIIDGLCADHYKARELEAIVQVLDGSQPIDPKGALFVAQNALKVEKE